MNLTIKKLWDAAAEDTQDASWQSQEQFVERLVRQVVGECVLAVLATDTRPLVFTTFDRGLVDSTISRVVDNLRNHFDT